MALQQTMMKQQIEEWNGADAITCAAALSDLPYTLFFDSNRPSHPLNRYSIICWNPIETITAKNGVITHNNTVITETDVFAFIQSRIDNNTADTVEHDLPFTGGAAGYFGYDLGRQLENLPTLTTDDINMPDMMVGIYTNVLIFDLKENTSWIITTNVEEKEFLETRLENHKNKTFTPTPLNWNTNKTDSEYCEDIQKVIDLIYAGDVYQVNLSRRFKTPLPKKFSAFAHYKHLRDINPAPFSAYMNFGALQLSSCSPERFLNVTGNEVETRPIKGTLPSTHPAEDLIRSKKDRAENTMIVDLLRNDLSKVCDFHSVKVPSLCALETFEGIHHLVSTVKGILQHGKKPTDLLRACFPGGSITGAPKHRAMEIIEGLESTRRGAYCGAMGYIGFDGNMDTNISIRTLIYANNTAYLQAGGGIVSDSIPTKELQETLDKVQKIFESFDPNYKTK